MNNNTLLRTVFRSLIALSMPALPMSAICQAANAATTYDVVRDFTTKANPSGAWSYSDGSGPLEYAHHRYQGVKSLDNWSNDETDSAAVTIARNRTGSPVTIYDGVLTVPTNYLLLSPSNANSNANVVFSAPTSGTYSIDGNFTGLDTPEGHFTLAYVLLNGSKAYFGEYLRSGKKSRFHLNLTLDAGDQLDFQCNGNNHEGRHDCGLTAKIVGP